MARKIAVLVRDRQEEALRMSLGLTLADDRIDVFVLGPALHRNHRIREYLELMRETEVGLYSIHCDDGGLDYLSSADIAGRLAGYDHVIAY